MYCTHFESNLTPAMLEELHLEMPFSCSKKLRLEVPGWIKHKNVVRDICKLSKKYPIYIFEFKFCFVGVEDEQRYYVLNGKFQKLEQRLVWDLLDDSKFITIC